ncbi:MAG: hypothetical protein IJ017_02630 [Oscillospiraceae bacterium]|nr:hypothetical protein [Oscillospiraceae bacterium]
MKKLLCVLLVLILALACVSCNSEPAVVWGEAAGVTNDAFLNKPDIMQIRNICGTESYTQETCVTEVVCTENFVRIEIETKNYAVVSSMLLNGDLSEELSKYTHFEQVENSYNCIGNGSSRHYAENEDGTAECTLTYYGINNIAEYGCFTLVLDDNEDRSPVIFLLNIENYGQMKTVDVVNRKGDVIGQAHISALYADIYMYPEKIGDADAFTQKLYILTAEGKTAAFENVSASADGDGYEAQLEFKDGLDINAVDHLLYKG